MYFQHYNWYHKKACLIAFTIQCYPICYDYVIMECRVQLDMSEGQKLNLAFH